MNIEELIKLAKETVLSDQDILDLKERLNQIPESKPIDLDFKYTL